jgi:argininosuccinate lyase
MGPSTVGTSVPSHVRTPQVAFLASLGVDRALAPYDLAGSIAHVRMLGASGILPPAEVRTLVAGLRTVGREIADGSFRWRPELEDVHTNIESRLTELVGPVGGKLHTARSRNDQVALDERLYLRAAVHRVAGALLALGEALVERAEEEAATPMPGYTHLQRAQVVSLGHHLLAHFWRFDRDVDRLLATAARADVSPLGAGALAGSTLAVRPELSAATLGFTSSFENSLDAVSDRDPLAELLFDLALVGVHASGLGEEVVVFATKEFGFLERTEGLGSGSSLMPQKRNPDVAELIRGRAGRPIGALVALLATLKGLPLAYDRDLQEDKTAVLATVDELAATLDALLALVRSLSFDRAALGRAAADPELAATDLAEGLVARGTPFREAHETVGRLFRAGSPPISSAAVTAALPELGADGPAMLEPTGALARRRSPGGPGPAAVATQLAHARARLAARRASLSSLGHKVALTEELLREERT